MSAVLEVMMHSLKFGVDLIEVREESLTFVKYKRVGEGKEQRIIGSASYRVLPNMLELHQAQAGFIARSIVDKLTQLIENQ